MKVLETMKLSNGYMILVCDNFSDNIVTDKIKTGKVVTANFTIEKPSNCMTAAKTRNIVVKEPLKIENMEFEFV